jgi:Leucine-rich repeat (LRR) protein
MKISKPSALGHSSSSLPFLHCFVLGGVVAQVTGLENLHTLWRLDLGCNQLTSCLDISSLVSIEQLSIDGNQIPSLKVLFPQPITILVLRLAKASNQ